MAAWQSVHYPWLKGRGSIEAGTFPTLQPGDNTTIPG